MKRWLTIASQALAKFAGIILTIHDLLGDQGLALWGLQQLKVAFSRFSQNAQQFPLVYESTCTPVLLRWLDLTPRRRVGRGGLLSDIRDRRHGG